MQIILADNQAIYRSGLTRVLKTELDVEVVVQCSKLIQLQKAVSSRRGAIVIFPSSFTSEIPSLLDLVERSGNRAVMILESEFVLDATLAARLHGVLLRSVAEPQLLDCLYRVAEGGRYLQRALVQTMAAPDQQASEAFKRLTERELQIVALICEGLKNKEIAHRLSTKEQSIKNYLRSIYSKVQVCDRLELALFAIHHQGLAEVVQSVRLGMARTA
ncbi:MAG: response regulator transcription factor [Acidobacteriota bacterium]